MAAAEAHLATGAPMRLSELGAMHDGAFLLLLELLGDALATGTTEVSSADGRFRVRLAPPADGAEAVVVTQSGTFAGPDYTLTVTPA